MAIAALNPGFSASYGSTDWSAATCPTSTSPASVTSGNPAASIAQAAGQWESFLSQGSTGSARREALLNSLQGARERLQSLRGKLDAARQGSLSEQQIPSHEAERVVAAQRQLETVQARQASLAGQRTRLAERREFLSSQLEEARAAASAPLPDGEEADLQGAMEARAAAQERVDRISAQLEALREEERNLEIAIRDNEQALRAAQSEVEEALAALENPESAEGALVVPTDLQAELTAAEAEVLQLEADLAALDAELASAAEVTNAQEGTPTPDPSVSSVPISEESDREAIEADQEAAIQQALSSGQPVSYQNSQGLTVTLSVTLVDGVYRVTDPSGDVMSVEWDGAATDEVGVVARAIDYWTQIPQTLQQPSLRVIVHTGDTNLEDPLAGEWADGAIHFYNSKNQESGTYYTAEDNVNERVFTHEYGHVIGESLQGPRDTFTNVLDSTGLNVPADFSFSYGHGDTRHSPTDYGDDFWAGEGALSFRTSHEAFAEHWTLYNEAVDQGPAALNAYRATYPNESVWFDRHFPEAAADRDALYPPPITVTPEAAPTAPSATATQPAGG